MFRSFAGAKKETDKNGKEIEKEGAVVKANKGMILRKSIEYIRWVPLLSFVSNAAPCPSAPLNFFLCFAVPYYRPHPQIPPTTRRRARRAQPRIEGATQELPWLVRLRLPTLHRRAQALCYVQLHQRRRWTMTWHKRSWVGVWDTGADAGGGDEEPHELAVVPWSGASNIVGIIVDERV
jgi:hypothetical protein